MCSYLTVATEIAGSAKGAQGWMPVTSASVYFDHPFHAPFDHTLNIDFADPDARSGSASPSSSVRSRRAAWSRASMRRWPLRGPPPCDHTHRPGGRRPPALGRGARARCGRGRPGRWRCGPVRARSYRWVLPGSDGGAGVPWRRHLREGGRRRAQSESPEFHRREAVVSAALPRLGEFPRLLDVYDDGDWVALAFEAINGGPPVHPWDAAAVGRLPCRRSILCTTP